MAAGGLVGDDIVNGIVANRITQPDCSNGFLLDGYPRTVAQAQYLSALLKKRGLLEPLVIHMDVPASVLIARLTARRQCPACKRIYNLISQPPRVAGKCDDDGTALITRPDDQEAVIRQRLEAYDELTGPVLQWYGASSVRKVDATKSPEEVAQEIEHVLAATVA